MKKNLTVEELVKMEMEYNEKQKEILCLFDEFQGLVPSN